MTRRSGSMMLLAAGLIVGNVGCVAVPVGLGTKAIGVAVNDDRTRVYRDTLVGEKPEMAEVTLGDRLTTWEARDDHDRALAVYPVEGAGDDYRYVVESIHKEIVAVAKVKRCTAAAEAIIEQAGLREKLEGLSPPGCEAALALNPALHILENEDTDEKLHVYSVHGRAEFGKARYLVLHFVRAELFALEPRCRDITLIGKALCGW